MLENPDPADWLNWRRTLDGWGYSPLDQITTENVHQLQLADGNPPEEVRVEASQEIIQASALREVLRSEGMLNDSAPSGPATTPHLQAWIDGDL